MSAGVVAFFATSDDEEAPARTPRPPPNLGDDLEPTQPLPLLPPSPEEKLRAEGYSGPFVYDDDAPRRAPAPGGGGDGDEPTEKTSPPGAGGVPGDSPLDEADVPGGGGGTLTDAEHVALQGIADRFKTQIDVVGSRASGKGRGVGSNLPVGKGEGTRSDIDVRIDSQLDIDTRGALSDALKELFGGDLVDVRPRLPGGSRPPVIEFKPQ